MSLKQKKSPLPIPTIEKTEVKGSIPKDVIRRLVRLQIPQIQYCYEKGLAKRPDLDGRVLVKFVISKDGIVINSAVADSSMGDLITERCIANVFSRISFPKPEDGGVVIATYPLTFRSAER